MCRQALVPVRQKLRKVSLIQHEHLWLCSHGTSGLLGLSFGKINTVTPTPVKTPVENMIEQGDIKGENQLFTCHLGSVKDAQDPDKGNSFYTFGSIDEDVIKASGQQVHYTPVDDSEGFWMFDSATATVNGKSVSLPGGRAMADTGTTLIMASNELCEAVYSQINGAVFQDDLGGWVFPAGIPTDKLPQVTLDIGGKQFNIEKENFAFAPADKAGTMIFGGIQPRGNLSFSIYGDTLLTGLYAVSLYSSVGSSCTDWYRSSTSARSDSAACSAWILPHQEQTVRSRS